MRTRRFFTTGNFDINEEYFHKPEPKDNEIEVQTKIVGICNSDIQMFSGSFGFPVPKEIQGHEGLGVVSKVGKRVCGVKEGDIVATNADNCFADFYNAPRGSFVIVDKLDPIYILEPIACAYNILYYLDIHLTAFGKLPGKILILGSGFLAKVIAEHLKEYEPLVVGSATPEYWSQKGIEQIPYLYSEGPPQKYDIVIDLKGRRMFFDTLIDNDMLNAGCIYIAASQFDEPIRTDLSYLLWKSVLMSCPSPRGLVDFYSCMHKAKEFVKEKEELVRDIWFPEGYDRNEPESLYRAFNDGFDGSRQKRGYLVW